MLGRSVAQFIPVSAQLEFPLSRQRVPDRNAAKGGRSFYFFDFDDNVMVLDTGIYLFHRDTGEELAVSTRQFAQVGHLVGRWGKWKHYELDLDDRTGSFRRFRDFRVELHEQPFVQDVLASLCAADLSWKGPSWELFFHAVFNERPIAIITARGHAPETFKYGLGSLCERGLLSGTPNYLDVCTVSNRAVRRELGDPDGSWSVPALKRAAIIRAVGLAMERYGYNPHHRFGMSDDDPNNIALIIDAMGELKARYPENAFFVIDTSRRPVIKTEVLARSVASEEVAMQLELFD